LAEELEATGLVVGLPLNMNGSEGEQAAKSRDFAGVLKAFGWTAILWDERLSTIEAIRRLREVPRKRRGGPQRVDSEAAAIILQSYLEHVRYRGRG
jgi:putative Holliday junction resolvase